MKGLVLPSRRSVLGNIAQGPLVRALSVTQDGQDQVSVLVGSFPSQSHGAFVYTP